MKGTRRIALCAILTAVAFALSAVESLLPFPMPLPGMKLGFANVTGLFALYVLGFREAALITLARCTLLSLLFGSPTQLAFSLSGGLVSLCVMALSMRSSQIGVYGVSIAGAAMHNITQVAVAALMLSTPGLFGYLAWLLPVSVCTGFAVALVYSFAEVHLRLPVKRLLRQDTEK